MSEVQSNISTRERLLGLVDDIELVSKYVFFVKI